MLEWFEPSCSSLEPARAAEGPRWQFEAAWKESSVGTEGGMLEIIERTERSTSQTRYEPETDE